MQDCTAMGDIDNYAGADTGSDWGLCTSSAGYGVCTHNVPPCLGSAFLRLLCTRPDALALQFS